MHDLSGLQRDILYVLAGMDGSHGLAIMDELDEHYQGGISAGRLYPNLDTLFEQGLLTKTQVDKRTNEYAITSRGYREIEDYEEWKRAHLDDDAVTDIDS